MRVLVLAKTVSLVKWGGNLFGGVQGAVGWLDRVGPWGNIGAEPTVLARLTENVRNGVRLGERSIKKWCWLVLLHLVKVPTDPSGTDLNISHCIFFMYDPGAFQKAAASALRLRESEFVHKNFKRRVLVSYSLWLYLGWCPRGSSSDKTISLLFLPALMCFLKFISLVVENLFC